MTVQRILLRAHQDDILVWQEAEQAIQRVFKIRRFPPGGIIDQAVRSIVSGIQRPAAELVPKELVDDFGGGELGHQRLAIELRKAETAGTAADITHNMNVVADEDSEQV